MMRAFHEALERGELSTTQKRGVISLIPKPGKDTMLLKNWRPITLLNTDYKYLAKAIANRIRNKPADIISTDQMGFTPMKGYGKNIY